MQVLKGPQGTLFGRNTTGGAILLVPQKPTSKEEGYIEYSYGNYAMNRIQAVVNMPLSDTVRFRLGFDRQSRQGYTSNYSGEGATRFDDTNYSAARASLVVDITPDLENYTIGSFFGFGHQRRRSIAGRLQPDLFTGTVCVRSARTAPGRGVL